MKPTARRQMIDVFREQRDKAQTNLARVSELNVELLEALKVANEILKECAEELCASGMSPLAECIRKSTELIAKAEGKP